MHQLVRNHGMRVFHPRDCTRRVTSSHMGQRSPSGRMKKNTTVATTMRSTKNATRTTANTTGTTQVRPFDDLQVLGSREPYRSGQLEPTLDRAPPLHPGNAIFDPFDRDLGAGLDGIPVQAFRTSVMLRTFEKIADLSRRAVADWLRH